MAAPAAARVNAGRSGAARDNDLPMLAATLPPSKAVPATVPAANEPTVTAIRAPSVAARNGAASRPKPGTPRAVMDMWDPCSVRL